MAQQQDAAAAQQLARLSHGSYGFKGLKDHYEDRVDTRHLGGLGLWFGVYDGHGGERAADYVQSHLGSAVERAVVETIPGFEERLGDARETAKRRKLAEGTTSSTAMPSVREKEELRAIENAAKEADARIEELRSVGYGSPELAELRDSLTNRRRWLDRASKKRKGGKDAGAALSTVEKAAKQRAEALREAGAAAAAAATVTIDDARWRPAIERAFLELDEAFLAEADRRKWDDGSCVCAGLLLEHARKLVTVNLGDSRLIVARGLGALRGTQDQKPESATEKRRIEKAGGYVVDLNGVWRATSAAGVGFGVDRRNKSLYLSVARSIGDRQLKRPTAVLSAAPEVRVLPLEDDDLLAVVVCDGVTDVLDDSAIVTLAVENFGKPEESARRIVREAFAKSAADNVTAVVVEFPWVDAAKVSAVRAKARSAIAEAKKQQADEPLDMFA